MSDPWRLSPTQKHQLLLAGVTPEDVPLVEDSRRRKWDTLMADADYVENKKHGYMLKYGIDHECHCADDAFTGSMVRVTACNAETADKAFDMLEQTLIERDMLIETVRTLRRQIEELGENPIA